MQNDWTNTIFITPESERNNFNDQSNHNITRLTAPPIGVAVQRCIDYIDQSTRTQYFMPLSGNLEMV